MCHFCEKDIKRYRRDAERAKKENNRLVKAVIVLATLLLSAIVVIIYMAYQGSQFDYIYYTQQDTQTGDNRIIITKDGVAIGEAEGKDQNKK